MPWNLLHSYPPRRLLSFIRLLQQVTRFLQRARRNVRPFLTLLSFVARKLRSYWNKRSTSRCTMSDTQNAMSSDQPEYFAFGWLGTRRAHAAEHPVSIAACRLPLSVGFNSQNERPDQDHTPEHPDTPVVVFSEPMDIKLSPTHDSPPAVRVDSIISETAVPSLLSEQQPDFWPVAPYFFKRYERSRTIPREYHDTKIPPLSVDFAQSSLSGWIPCEHPEGALYFHHSRKNIFTDADLHHPDIMASVNRLVDLYDDFISKSHIFLDPTVELVLDYEETGEYQGRCGYYLVDHHHRSVFWLDDFETVDLPDWNEVPGVTSQAHIRHELESQYWYHCELFPHTREVTQELIDEIRDLTTHALGDVSTSPLSTIESTVDELQIMLQTITSAERQVGKEAPGSMCIMSRFMHIRARHRFLNFHGQPPARLGRDQAIYNVTTGANRSYLITLLSPTLFSAPEVYLRTLNSVYVDQIVYAHGINKLISKLNNEWQEFILYATVLLNANVALLAIQSVDVAGEKGRTPVQICSYVSIALSIGCIILGLLLVRQNRTKGKESAPEAMHFMGKHSVEILAIMYSLPYALLMWAMLAFLSAFAFLCFDSTNLVTRLIVGAVCVALATLIVWCIWYAWESHGPNAWWHSVFGTLDAMKTRLAGTIRPHGGQGERDAASMQSSRSREEKETETEAPARPKRPWRWATIFRAKRPSIDSEKTTV